MNIQTRNIEMTNTKEMLRAFKKTYKEINRVVSSNYEEQKAIIGGKVWIAAQELSHLFYWLGDHKTASKYKIAKADEAVYQAIKKHGEAESV